eukprot:351140-Chlamydomonas_euryale.AAC.53
MRLVCRGKQWARRFGARRLLLCFSSHNVPTPHAVRSTHRRAHAERPRRRRRQGNAATEELIAPCRDAMSLFETLGLGARPEEDNAVSYVLYPGACPPAPAEPGKQPNMPPSACGNHSVRAPACCGTNAAARLRRGVSQMVSFRICKRCAWRHCSFWRPS